MKLGDLPYSLLLSWVTLSLFNHLTHHHERRWTLRS
jgi:hypothetical protein